MIKKHKSQLILSSIVILLPILAGLFLHNYLPDQLTTHWNANGEADGWSSKYYAIFGLPLILLLTHWICIFFTIKDPKNKEQSSKIFNMTMWIMPVISNVVCIFVYIVALGKDLNPSIIVCALLGLVFIIIGNYMPKCKQNHTIGIKVTWTLRNEENWYKTHRFAGHLWVIGGSILLVTMFMPMEKFIYVFLPMIFIMAFLPMIYSYCYYKKQLKNGTATKDDAKMTDSEKKFTKISSAIGIIVLVLAISVLFVGKFDISFNETSFSIDATFWDDITVNYSDIDTCEYRTLDDPNASSSRSFGYGSFNILMGEFKNNEFGTYTRYSHTSCDSCVVLTVNGKTLVLNGKNDEQTKQIYENIQNRLKN